MEGEERECVCVRARACVWRERERERERGRERGRETERDRKRKRDQCIVVQRPRRGKKYENWRGNAVDVEVDAAHLLFTDFFLSLALTAAFMFM